MARRSGRPRLRAEGARLADAVKVTAYLSDMRWSQPYRQCLLSVFPGNAKPAATLINLNRPVVPGSRLTIEVTAAVAP